MSEQLASNALNETCVTLQVKDGIARLTLARPDRSNAINDRLAKDLHTAVCQIVANTGVRVVLLSGEGKNFCVGGDLKSFAAEGVNAPAYVNGIIENLHAALIKLTELPVPVVSVVHGAAAGAGLGLALAADIVVAADNAKFVMAYTKAGVTPDGGTTWILPRLVGLHRALDLTLRNQILSADEAKNLGMIAEVHAPGDLVERTNAIAAELAKGPTEAYGQAKRLLRQSLQSTHEAQLASEGETVVKSFASRDGQEGAKAFADDRKPVFHPLRPVPTEH